MEKLDRFQAIFVNVDEFGWWNTEILETDAGTHFTSMEFQKGLSVRVVQLSLEEPYHQGMNGQVEVI